MAIRCDTCDNYLTLDEAEETENGDIICEDCEIRAARKAHEKKLADVGGSAGFLRDRSVECARCGFPTEYWIEKNEGPLCINCSHAYELAIHSAGHDFTTCSICTNAA